MSSSSPTLPRLAITPGEPAGIGPDVALMAARQAWPAELVCIADRSLLETRARALGLDIELIPYTAGREPRASTPGQLLTIDIPTREAVVAGELNPANASYVLATLNHAADLCLSGEAQGMVTAPVQKSVINDAGIAFSGHTEFLADLTDSPQVVMMLAAADLRVALATTHLPLRAVPDAITTSLLVSVLTTLDAHLKKHFGLPRPRITVLGLNPHAGENGHLGQEEMTTIIPALDIGRQQGLQLIGPLPADTAFNSDIRDQTDAYVAMYHDQGLPVLKYAGFGDAVNITLGLPIIRTSVDHGTALPLAGTGRANPGSLLAAINTAIDCANRTTQ